MEKLNYELVLLNWSPFFIDMMLKFETPSDVSRSSIGDLLSLKILKPEDFVTRNGGL